MRCVLHKRCGSKPVEDEGQVTPEHANVRADDELDSVLYRATEAGCIGSWVAERYCPAPQAPAVANLSAISNIVLPDRGKRPSDPGVAARRPHSTRIPGSGRTRKLKPPTGPGHHSCSQTRPGQPRPAPARYSGSAPARPDAVASVAPVIIT
jgi:hypothetical protein